MRNCNNNGRFLNEQTYLDTICRKGKCKKPKHEDKYDCEYMQYTCQTRCGRISVRQDKCQTNLEIGINHNCCTQGKHSHCDKH